MISLIQPLSAGNAVRVMVQPPAGATCWRILRNTTGIFAGASDPAATIVAARVTDETVLDLVGLTNNVEYFYRDFTSSDDGATWTDSGTSVSATPSTSYFDPNPDPQELVRDRIELGLAAEVARGALLPVSGSVPVFTSPFGIADNIKFPCVSVHLDSSASADRGLGELMDTDQLELSGDVAFTSGWLARVRLQVVGVSQNSDERIALRKTLRRIVQANLPVFDNAGMVQISFSQSDTEQFIENGVPLYLTAGSFECLAPAVIVERDPYIDEFVIEQVDAHGRSTFLAVDNLPGEDVILVTETNPITPEFHITADGDIVDG